MLDTALYLWFCFVIERYLREVGSHITTKMGTYAHTVFLSNS